jgi:hypothetical protein
LRKIAAVAAIPVAFLVEAARVAMSVAITIAVITTYTTRSRRAILRTIAAVAAIPVAQSVETLYVAIPVGNIGTRTRRPLRWTAHVIFVISTIPVVEVTPFVIADEVTNTVLVFRS